MTESDGVERICADCGVELTLKRVDEDTRVAWATTADGRYCPACWNQRGAA